MVVSQNRKDLKFRIGDPSDLNSAFGPAEIHKVLFLNAFERLACNKATQQDSAIGGRGVVDFEHNEFQAAAEL